MHNMFDAASKTIREWPPGSQDKGPTEGNHRLTALTGSLLVPLLALIFATGLFMDAWWHVHYVIGFVLIPVVVLKLASTGYRALRYYTSNPTYKAAGPPELLPRLLAPLLAASVLTALVTGVLLFAEQSRRGTLSSLHTDAAVATAVLVAVHLLTYLPDAVATVGRELRAMPLSRPASLRLAAVAAILAVGIIVAIVTYNHGLWPARPHDRRLGAGVFLSLPGAGSTLAGEMDNALYLPGSAFPCVPGNAAGASPIFAKA
jgi:membrane protein YdbS with pleckstrin-like domain